MIKNVQEYLFFKFEKSMITKKMKDNQNQLNRAWFFFLYKNIE